MKDIQFRNTGLIPFSSPLELIHNDLRQYLLYFDNLALLNFDEFEDSFRKFHDIYDNTVGKKYLASKYDEIKNLIELGICTAIEGNYHQKLIGEIEQNCPEKLISYLDKTKNLISYNNDLIAQIKDEKNNLKKNSKYIFSSVLIDLINYQGVIESRLLSLFNMTFHSKQQTPIFSAFIGMPENIKPFEGDVVRIVLNKIPIPNNSIPFSELMQFKNEPDSKLKYYALRNWMNEVARSKLEPIEIEDKIEYLLSDYESHLKLNKVKYELGTLEVYVCTTVELIENIVKFKWGKIAKSVFNLQKQKIKLIEADFNSPGRELAYISKVNNL